MTRKRRPKGDPIEHEIELVLNPGAFISYDACFSFVSDLDEVATKIAKLLSSDPARAVTLYETFLAACYMKIEELDDSSGSFGQFVDDLYCGWIEARQAVGADPDETASHLLNWMDQDDYGFCHRLEMDAVRVFDKANLAAFAKRVRARFDAAANKTAKTDDKLRDHPDYLRRRWGEVLRTLYAAQKDVAAYVALAEETGLTAKDCHAIATLLVSKRKPEEPSLGWNAASRSTSSHRRARWPATISPSSSATSDQARPGDEALDAAWSTIASTRALLLRRPHEVRAQSPTQAVARESHRGGDGRDLHSVMDLLLKTRSWTGSPSSCVGPGTLTWKI